MSIKSASNVLEIKGWFDDRLARWGKRLSYPHDTQLIKTITQEFIDAGEGGALTDKQVKALSLIILNLSFIHSQIGSHSCLAILTANGKSTGKSSLSHSIYGVVGSVILKAIMAVDKSDLIAYERGFKDPESNKGHATKLKLTQAGLDLINGRINPALVCERPSPVIYKDLNKQRHVPSRAVSNKHGGDLIEQYNALMDKSRVSVGDIDLYGAEKMVFRLFADEKCKFGGRMYAALWQRMPKELRKALLINGESTIEVDIKSTHPLIAYALEKKDVTEKNSPTQPEGINYKGDPYSSLLFDQAPKDAKGDRGVIKSLVTMMFNVNSDRRKRTDKQFINAVVQAFHENATHDQLELIYRHYADKFAFERELDDDGNETNMVVPSGYEFSVKKLVEAILERHEVIGHRFGASSWKVFDRHESNILLRVIKHFTNQDIPILTIHDSVRIAASHQDELIEVYIKSIESELCKNGFNFSDRTKLVSLDDGVTDLEPSEMARLLLNSREKSMEEVDHVSV